MINQTQVSFGFDAFWSGYYFHIIEYEIQKVQEKLVHDRPAFQVFFFPFDVCFAYSYDLAVQVQKSCL